MSVKNFSNTVDVTKLGIPKIEAEIADLSSKVLPDVTSADNGKVLKVAEGAWGVGTDNSLPDVTSADNGKVLKVANGEWGVGADNSGILVYEATCNNAKTTITLPKQMLEIINEISAHVGSVVILVKPTNQNAKMVYYMVQKGETCKFVCFEYDSLQKYTKYDFAINYGSSNTVYATKTAENMVPDATTSMNGYILQVVNGLPNWVNLDGNNDQF